MSGVSASPSWALTTLQWLEARRPEYVAPVRSPDARVKLKQSLLRMSFEKVQSQLADEDDAGYDRRLDERVANWDDELHRQMVEFLNEGGYKAEHARAFGKPKAKGKGTKKPKVETAAEKETVVISGRMAGKATAIEQERELAEALEHEVLARDKRLGAW